MGEKEPWCPVCENDLHTFNIYKVIIFVRRSSTQVCLVFPHNQVFQVCIFGINLMERMFASFSLCSVCGA